jgi:mycothiol synthase
VLKQGFSGTAQARRTLLEGRGYAPSRTFWRMRIDQTVPPPAPEWPVGITVRTYQPGTDDRAVYEAVEEAFHDHWEYHMISFEEWMVRPQKPDFDPSLWFLAMDGDEIAGATLCTKEPTKGWINKVAVRRPWRKRGIAMSLLYQAFGAFWERGVTRVELGVDAQSLTNAQELYLRAGMNPAAEWAIYAKTLREGKGGE